MGLVTTTSPRTLKAFVGGADFFPAQARARALGARARASIDVACGSSTLWLAACPRPPRRTRPPRVAARAGNAATDANADAQNDIVAVEFAPDGGRERVDRGSPR